MMTALILVLLGGMAAGRVWGACEVPTEWRATRPNPEGQPTEVTVGLYLIDLRAINDSEQSFLADIFFSVTWKDPRLVSDTGLAPLVGCRIELDEIWNPRLIFVNEGSVKRLLDKKVTVGPDGTVEYVQRLQGEFTTPLDLRDFPFDKHELSLEVIARGYLPEQVAFVPEAGGGQLAELTITDWVVGEGSAEVEGRYIEPGDWTIAAVTFKVPVQRRIGFYSMKTFLPLTLIVCMSWAVFWIKPGLLPPQIGVSTSAILTLIAFQFSLGYLLPRLSYLTRADRFLIGSTLLVFMAFGEALRTSYLANRDQEDRALRIDKLSRVLFPVLFSLLLVVSFVL
jgi:hypothetical protein